MRGTRTCLGRWLSRCEVGEEGISKFPTIEDVDADFLKQLHQLIFAGSTFSSRVVLAAFMASTNIFQLVVPNAVTRVAWSPDFGGITFFISKCKYEDIR